jgi:hypothetical protein
MPRIVGNAKKGCRFAQPMVEDDCRHNMGNPPINEDPMSTDGQPAAATPNHGRSAFKNEDLAVLLKELHRVRDSAGIDRQSAGEAMTLAHTAVRIVESELGRVGTEGLSHTDVAKAREVLQGALEALQAAADRVGPDSGPTDGRRTRTKWHLRRAGHEG